MNPVSIDLPVLTDVVASEGLSPAQQAAVLGALPGLVQDVVGELRPHFEQQLLDALLPRVAALVAMRGDATQAGQPDR
jgi:hypothetical protein